MNDLRYILQEPIEIDGIGKMYPMNIIEFSKNEQYFSILSITKNYLLQQTDPKDKDKRNYIEENVKNFDVIMSQGDLIKALIKLLSICLKIDISKIREVITNDIMYISLNWDNELFKELSYLDKNSDTDKIRIQEIESVLLEKVIHRDNYDFIRNQILKMYSIHLPKQAKTSELQKWFDKARKAKSRNNKTDMEDIITTIVATTGITFNEIKQMSIYQINKLIERINKVKEYDTNIQFICVGAKDVKLTSYLEHLEDEMEENLSVSLDKIKGQMGSSME